MNTTLLNEKDVEHFYRSNIERATSARFTSPHKTDGYIEWGSVRMLLEVKFDAALKTQAGRANVIAQTIHYIKKFQADGGGPNLVLIGDKHHYFMLPTSQLETFLERPFDWTRAPSAPDDALKAAVLAENIVPYIDTIPTSDFSDLVSNCVACAQVGSTKRKATPKNINALFVYWRDCIFTKDKALSNRDKLDLFFAIMFHDENEKVFKHPKKKNTIILSSTHNNISTTREIALDIEAMDGFFTRYQRGYSPSEIDALTRKRDRLIESYDRSRRGDYFTDADWAAECHKMIREQHGSAVYSDAIWYDPACGVANLTSDETITELLLSTLDQSDIHAIQREGYNEGATIFQQDFLDLDISKQATLEHSGLPHIAHEKLLRAAADGKRIIFIMNPPFATANNAGANTTAKAGVADTKVNKAMKAMGLGKAASQLYAQFLFQCEQVANAYGFEKKSICVFSTPLFMTGPSFKAFRDFWYRRYSYQGGFLFEASHFADVSPRWGVSFTIWNEGETSKTANLPITLKDKLGEDIVSIGSRQLYNSDDRSASDWLRQPTNGLMGEDGPQMQSGLNVAQSGSGSLVKDALMYFTNNANNLVHAQTLVYFTASCGSIGHGCSVLAGESWRRAIALFSARKLASVDWRNQKDELLAPNTAHADYEQWVDDCHIYALLHMANNMTAMRNVEYKGKSWTINNHFFWLTRQAALKLYDTRETIALYRDCKASQHDPYFAEILPTLKLSPLAAEILSDLTALFSSTLAARNGQEDRLHALCWDAGIFQLKGIWGEDARWVALKQKHRLLAEQLQHGVYTFGFLK